MSTFKKYAKKQFNRAKGYAKKRYTQKGAPLGLNMKNIAHDISMLKKVINAEKKHFGPLMLVNPYSVGQVSINGQGSTAFVATPGTNMVEGTGRENRTGNSVKAHAFNYDFQVIAQASQKNIATLIFELYRVPNQIIDVGSLGTILTCLSQVYVPNKWLGDGITYYDSNSSRNPDYFKDYKLVRRKIVRVIPDAQSNTYIKTFRVGYKPKGGLHQRYAKSPSGTISYQDGQLIWIVRCSNGNAGGSASTVTGAAETTAATGFDISCSMDMYFYDN